MWRVTMLIWTVLGATFAGIAMVVVLSVPALAASERTLIPIVAAIGALVAIPVSVLVAKAITRRMA